MRLLPHRKPLTLRRRVTLAFISINLIFACNVAFFVWSNYRRKHTVDNLRRSITSQQVIGEIQNGLTSLQKQVTLLNQSVVDNASGLSPEEIDAFRGQLDEIRSRIQALKQTARGEVGTRTLELDKGFAELSASWLVFYQNFGVRHATAIMEMAMRSEPLGQRLLQGTLPALLEAERRDADAASASFELVAQLTDRISILLFILSGVVALTIAYKLTHYLTSVLAELKLGVSMIGASHFGHKIKVEANDELGDLAAAFNDMSDHLHFAKEQLVGANAALEARHKEVESLLLNILPGQIATELTRNDNVEPKYFEDVSILFTDFVGFTVSTERLAAEELVYGLNEYFTSFDQITQRYGVEKLKTIGDSYMCVAGMPERNPAHPVDMVLAAMEMVHAVERLSSRVNSPDWSVRVGIHSGPVIAGVVGIKKFAFDIWGDAVNFSSRMEASGSANRINVSERTYSRIKDFFQCHYRGKVLTKDKREVDMYFVDGVLPSLLDGDGVGPPPAFLRRYRIYFQKTPPAFPDFLVRVAANGIVTAAPGTAGSEL